MLRKFFFLSFMALTLVFSQSVMAFSLSPRGESSTTPEVIRNVELKIPRIESAKDPEVKRDKPIPKNQTGTTSLSAPLGIFSQTLSQTSTLGPNLISNPSFEASATTATGWSKGGYGTNTRSFSFPVSGFNSPNAAQVSIGSYTSGDAKWFFNDVPVTAGHTYQFSDFYISNVSTIVDVRYKMIDGTFIYTDIANTAPSTSYQNLTTQFTVPANVVSLTIFHLINQPGNLTTDAYLLNELTSSTPPPPPQQNNLISNGDFETAGSNGNPANWSRGGWGTNNRTFSYPVSGISGNAAKVQISSYTSGDAKWYFNPIQLSSGVYTFSDQYISNLVSIITVQFKNSDGSFSYKNIATVPPASSFAPIYVDFSVPANVLNVTIFHLIKGVGALTIDNANLQSKTSSAGVFTTGAVTLTFDDGLESQYQNAIPKLNSTGLKGTFFIVSRQLADYGFSGSLSIAQIKDIFQHGNEIGAHTRTHPHLTQLSATEEQSEILGSRQDLQALNVGPIISFSYPYGEYDATTLQIVKDSGFTDARSTINGATTQTSDRFQLPRFGMQNTTTFVEVRQAIDNAMINKEWLIIAFHGIDTSGTQYSTTPAMFSQIIDYLVSKSVPVVTISQAIGDVSP